MKINLNVRKHFYAFLLVCLVASPMTALADVSAPQSERLSETLQSQKAEDLLLYAQSMPYGLVQNNAYYQVIANRGFLTPDEMAQQGSAEKSARFGLFKDLQFTNHAHLKSIVAAFKPKTQAGKLKLESLLASGNTDWKLTEERKAFIKELASLPAEKRAELHKNLEILRDNENLCLSKFAPVNPAQEAANNMASMVMYGQAQAMLLLAAIIPEFAQEGSVLHEKKWQKLAAAEALLALVFAYNKKLAPKIAKLDAPSNVVNVLSRVGFGALAPALLYDATINLFQGKGLTYGLSRLMFGVLGKTDRSGNPVVVSKRGRCLPGLYALLGAGGAGFMFYNGYQESVKQFADMNGLSRFVTASAELRQLILSEEISSKSYKNAFGGMSESWRELERRAEDHKGSRGPTWWCTNNSNINNIVALMKQTSADVARTIQFYGEIDAYLAVAQFVVDHQLTSNDAGEPIRVCYSEFIENSEESILDAVNAWHPIISADRVRSNSIKLGGSPETPRNAVVTGPNAAGKSVNLKSLLVNLIIAQTFGIACAESFKFTPFTKIIGRLNAPDDTAADHSKFMLEALDVVNMLTQLKSLKTGEHAFVVTDELFSGTEVGPAIELSKKLCKRVAGMKNVIYILATHYKDLVDLKASTNNAFENYKVSVTKNADGSLTYPFKLDHGVGHTNVAFDIFLQQMKQQGLEDEDLLNMIMEARQAQEAQEAAIAA